MEPNKQNSCLMTTTFDEETGRTMLTYIPMSLDFENFEELLMAGKYCTNKECVSFELDENADSFWKNMWDDMKGEPDEC